MLLIDTSNVLHVTGVLPTHLAGLDVPMLARLIAASRYGRRRSVLVCDGVGPPAAASGPLALPDAHSSMPAPTNTAPSGKEIAGLDVVYAGAGREADDVIELLIARDSAPRRLLVVSTDRRIARAARRRQARSISSEDFLRQLANDSDKPKAKPLPGFATQVPLNQYAVGYWMAMFGYGPAGEQAPPGQRPVTEVSQAAQRGLDAERARQRAEQMASSPHAHERLKIPRHLLEAQGTSHGSATNAPPPAKTGKPSAPPPQPPQPPPPRSTSSGPPPSTVPKGELPQDLAGLLKDSGLSIDPADLDMRTWLPKDDT